MLLRRRNVTFSHLHLCFNGSLSASTPSVWEQTTHSGETPLFLAVSNCLLENACFLLLNGCNPNAKNFEGNSPLLTGKQTCFWESPRFQVSSLPLVSKATFGASWCPCDSGPKWLVIGTRFIRNFSIGCPVRLPVAISQEIGFDSWHHMVT